MKTKILLWAGLIMGALVSPATAESVLIFGGFGHTGSRIAKILAGEGHDVTAFVRPSSSRDRLAGAKVRFAAGDVFKKDTVAAAIAEDQPDAVIAVLQSRRGQGSVHGEPEIRIIELAKQAGVTDYIYLSSVGAGADTPAQRRRYPGINFDTFGSALEKKGDVETAFIASGLRHKIVRSGSILVEFGREPPPGPGRGYFTEDQDVLGPITYDDLALLMERCVGINGCTNKIYHANDDTLGPEYNHWLYRRFAPRDKLDEACDHLRPI